MSKHISWTQDEISYLKNNYRNLDRKTLAKNLQNHSWGAILSKVSSLGLTGQYLDWTPEEINFLKEHYQTAPQHYLSTNLQNRKWKSISKKASILGLERISILRKANLSILLEETPITYYWLGFLMADGGFTDRRLQLGVAHKDLNHLKIFRDFVGSSNKIGKVKNKHSGKLHYRIKIACIKVIQALKDKFKISNRKTYEPCDISNIPDELMFSLIIGFIDGDGSLYNTSGQTFRLSVVGHPNWLSNFATMKSFIYNYFGYRDYTRPPRITTKYTILPQDKTKTKKKYYAATFHIDRTDLIHAIRNKAIELKLPFLKRKLGKV